MKKLLLLSIILLFSTSVFSQNSLYYKRYKAAKGEYIEKELPKTPKSHLEDYETLSKRSGYYQYGALGCMAASIGCFAGYATLENRYNYTFDKKGNVTEKKMRAPARNYLMSGAGLVAISILCEALSIDCRIRAAQSLKLYATSNGAGLALNF